MVCKSIIDKKLVIPTKLLVCLVTNNFDNFNGVMEKVVPQAKIYLGRFQKLFINDTDEEIVNSLNGLSLDSEPNKDLIKMMTKEEGLDVEDEIASHVFVLTRKLKRNKYTKQANSQSTTNQPTPAAETTPQVTRRLSFKLANIPGPMLSFVVNLNTKILDLTIMVCQRINARQYGLQNNLNASLWRNPVPQQLPRDVRLKDLPIPIQNDEMITLNW